MDVLSRAGNPRTVFRVSIAAICASSLLVDGAMAQQRRKSDRVSIDSIGTSINSNTVSVVSGNLNGTYLSIAYDLSAVLDDGDNLRILPVVGKGGGQNIRDVRFLRGIDIGITQSNLLRLFQGSNEIGPIDEKVLYIARLFNEEMHLIVRAESGIASIEQLAGKKVNFSDAGSGTQLSSRDIFERLGVKAIEVNMGQNDAFEALKSGEIAATVLIAGKPTGSTSKLKASDGFRVLPVPFGKPLQDDYLPSTLTNKDYPSLIEPGRDIDTVAVGAVLIAYNWARDTDRYRRIAKFIDAFFPRLNEFQKPPRHPKWREANLAAAVPGWRRFPAAEEWLKRGRESQARLATQNRSASREQFDRFLARHGKSASPNAPKLERDLLFEEFLKWNQNQEAR